MSNTYGNVWEWTQDWYGEDYYASSPSNDPPGPASGTKRVVRGGSFFNSDRLFIRSAFRSNSLRPTLRLVWTVYVGEQPTYLMLRQVQGP